VRVQCESTVYTHTLLSYCTLILYAHTVRSHCILTLYSHTIRRFSYSARSVQSEVWQGHFLTLPTLGAACTLLIHHTPYTITGDDPHFALCSYTIHHTLGSPNGASKWRLRSTVGDDRRWCLNWWRRRRWHWWCQQRHSTSQVRLLY
jgi:hypothetical protein